MLAHTFNSAGPMMTECNNVVPDIYNTDTIVALLCVIAGILVINALAQTWPYPPKDY